MSEFDAELRRQLEDARHALAAARRSDDHHGAQAYRGRVEHLLRLAAAYGLQVPHETDDEGEG